MLKSTAIITFLLLFMASGICAAEQSASKTQTIEFSVSDYNRHYVEEYEGTVPDYETGWMKGLHISYKNQDNKTGNYWRLLYEKTNHSDSYIGSLQDNAGNYMGPYNSITKNKITNYEITFANPIADTDNAYAYIGLGSYSWDRDVMGSETLGVPEGFEKYSWKYIPIGYRNEYSINSKWYGAVDIALRFPFQSKMKGVKVGGIDPFEVNLGKKPGLKIELPFNYKMGSRWSLSLTTWYEYWAIGQSNMVAQKVNGVQQYYHNDPLEPLGVLEPGSRTNQLGLNMGISFCF